MPKKGSKQPYKPKKEFTYTIQDIADLAGITRNALNVAKAHGKINHEDFRSVVTFLTKRIIQQRLGGDIFAPPHGTESNTKQNPKRSIASSGKAKKTLRHT